MISHRAHSCVLLLMMMMMDVVFVIEYYVVRIYGETVIFIFRIFSLSHGRAPAAGLYFLKGV